MFFDHQGEIKAVDYIINTINQYNHSAKPEETIHVIIHSSSDLLQLMGMTTIVTSLKASRILTVPQAILSHSHLRKEYGIPILHENNFHHDRLSVMQADRDGVSTCYQSTLKMKQALSVADTHRVITEIVTQIQKNNYLRSLKKLLVLLTYLMLIDPEGKRQSQSYLALLSDGRKKLISQKSDIHYFDQYIPRIKNILEGHAVPFHADENFRQQVMHYYPIMHCSTRDIKTIPHDALRLDTVKIMFVPAQYAEELKNKLQQMKLNIQVSGYSSPEASNELRSINNRP